MITVEIPAALAADPQVVPVDDWRATMSGTCRTCTPWVCRPGENHDGGRGACERVMSSLVGQRVALAWRETCPTCGGRGEVEIDLDGRCPYVLPCGSCDGNGERMVVGWTAEVEAVASVETPDSDESRLPLMVWTSGAGDLRLAEHAPDEGHPWREVRKLDHLLPLADWSPGRYALVLRDVQPLTHYMCRPFSGFAELDEVLA